MSAARASYLFRDNRRQTVLRDVLRGYDALALLLAAMIASAWRFGIWLPPGEFWIPMVSAVLLYLAMMEILGGYRLLLPGEGRLGFRPAFMSLVVTLSLLFTLGYFSKTSETYSRLWVGIWIAAAFTLNMGARLAVVFITNRMGKGRLFASRMVVLASPELLPVVDRLRMATPRGGYFVDHAFYICDEDFPLPEGDERVTDIEAFLRGQQARMPDVLAIALTKQGEEAIAGIYDDLLHLPINILVYPFAEEHSEILYATDWAVIGGLPFIRRQAQPLDGRGWAVKTVEDYVLATLFSIVALPVMLLIGLLIKLDSPGPVLFTQKRHGFNGEEIFVYKFRTMKHGRPAEDDVPQATKDDPRTTRIGRILRRTSLDELPQLINVLQGRMSLIGPRPHAVEHNNFYRARIDGYLSRHRVKPGITGWAQVNGWRGETDTEEKMIQRVQHDLYYIQNWSFGLDMRILFMTALTGFVSRRAY